MTSKAWNYADVWEFVADRFPGELAAAHGDRELTWGQFDSRADGIAAALLDAGLGHQAKVAQYLRNRPEYLESVFASFKAGLVPVNTNYRYGDDELAYLWTDSDTAAVVFEEEFVATCERLRPSLPAIKIWLFVGEADRCPDWAVSYDDAAATGGGAGGRVVAPWGRSGDDLCLLYTGGTTGMPKGVMWQQHDLFHMLENQYGRTPPELEDIEGYLGRIERPGPRVLPAPPLMHGTASWFSMAAMSAGGSVVTLTGTRFDARELLDTVVGRQAKGVCIVGDPFAKPILAELRASPGRWDLSHVRLIMSSGAMLSRESKQALIEAAPNAKVVDGLGSSESGSLGSSVTTSGDVAATARFRLNDVTRVVDDEGRDVAPGSGERGRLAVGGHLPLGYYGDEAKTASTWLVLDGKRYVIAGDWAEVDADGGIVLLGRGSNCINTAGEKVYPEEVEEVLKTARGVRDAAVVGVPDERFGQAVVALVEAENDHHLDAGEVIAHVKAHLAGYKAPKAVIGVPAVARHANGKMDYRVMRELALETLGLPND